MASPSMAGGVENRPVELTNQFTVPLPADQAWELLNDVEFVALCIPGCRLLRSDGDLFEGDVKLRIGPIITHFEGTATVLERDDARHRVALRARGRDARGQGDADALISAHLGSYQAGLTDVTVRTELTTTGAVAHFGQGVVQRVAASFMAQFAERLEAKLGEAVTYSDERGPSGEASSADATAGARARELAIGNGGTVAPANLLPTPSREVVVLMIVAAGTLVTWLVARRRQRSPKYPAGDIGRSHRDHGLRGSE